MTFRFAVFLVIRERTTDNQQAAKTQPAMRSRNYSCERPNIISSVLL